MTKLTLSNCYTPLVIDSSSSTAAVKPQPLVVHRTRTNGDDGKPRSGAQLRRIHLAVDVSTSNNSSSSAAAVMGSSLVELGHSKVLCRVVHGNVHLAHVEEGVLDVQVEWAPNFGRMTTPDVSGLDQQHHLAARTSSASTKTLSVEYAAKIKEAILPAMVSLQHLPKTVISVQLTILQDDGSILSACIMASSLALSNASLELYDLVTSCTVCCMDSGEVLVDPTMEELQVSSGSLTLTMLYAWKEVTLWQQTGLVDSNAMELAKEGCRTLSKFMRECLVQSS
jgi:exosome complex component MTR3